MASAERRAREKENLRRSILDAARELFVTEDYRAVSMRRIADKIEYSPTTIYLYFKDKDEILASLVQEGFHLLSDQLERLDIPDPVERLRQGGAVYLRFAQTQPHYYKLMFQIEEPTLLERCVESEPVFEAAMRALGFIRRCVQEAMEQGRFVTDTPEIIVSHVILSGVHGVASLALAGRLTKLPPEVHEAFFHASVNTILRGLSVARE